jgi:opacity protein-like surface antigen
MFGCTLTRALLTTAVAAFLVGAPSVASAQTVTTGQQSSTFQPLPPEGEGFSLTPFVGAGFAGDYEDAPAGFGLALGYGANERISLEGELGFEPSGTQGEFLQVDTNVWTLSGNVLYHFAQPQFTPYVTLGLGVVGSDPDFGDDLLPEDEDSTTAFAFNWGGGIKSALNDRVGIRADIRYFNADDLAPDHWRFYGGVMIRNIGRW